MKETTPTPGATRAADTPSLEAVAKRLEDRAILASRQNDELIEMFAAKDARAVRQAAAGVADLLALVTRAQSILSPNSLWTKAEKARSWEAWQSDARALLAAHKQHRPKI